MNSKRYLLDGSSSESDSDSGGGIYFRKLNQTKKDIKQLHSEQYDAEEKKILENKDYSEDEEDTDKENDSISLNDTSDSDTEPSSSKYKKKEKEDSPAPPSPPPPPTLNNLKRKTVSKQLQELEFMKNFILPKSHTETSLIESEVSINENEFDKYITVRVSTKDGIKKWEILKTDTFKKIFEDLAKLENTNMENMVLMLRERTITFNDSPLSVDLQVCDIIDCGKVAKAVQERIKIIDGDNDDELESQNSNMITITLQGEEGRKSRVKFLIAKDESFKSVLQKYCEKRDLDFENYIIEFDGEKVDLDETPIDLDIEGGEIFDVRRSNKPILEHVNENKENYEFDDEVICV